MKMIFLRHFILSSCPCFCSQRPAVASTEEDGYEACSVEDKLDLEADVYALPNDAYS